MRKYGTGRVITEEGDSVRKTAAAQPLTEDDVQEIEHEGTEPTDGE